MFQDLAQKAKTELSALLSFREEEETKQFEMQHMEIPTVKAPPPPPPKEIPETKETTYATDIMALEKKKAKLEEKIAEKEALYKDLDKNLEEADKFLNSTVNTYKTKEERISAINGRIAVLEREMDAESEQIKKLLGPESTEQDNIEGKKRLNALSNKNGQVGSLKDMVDVLEGKKEMYNKDGQRVDSFKDAEYIVPSDPDPKKRNLKLVKEGEQLYLLNKNENLTDDNRASAKEAFEKYKYQMSSVKDLVQHNKQTEMGELHSEIDSISKEIDNLQVAEKDVRKLRGLSPMQDVKSSVQTHSGLSQLASSKQDSTNDQVKQGMDDEPKLN